MSFEVMSYFILFCEIGLVISLGFLMEVLIFLLGYAVKTKWLVPITNVICKAILIYIYCYCKGWFLNGIWI